MIDESFNEKLVGEMFIAYVSNTASSLRRSRMSYALSVVHFLRATMRTRARHDPAVPIDKSITRRLLDLPGGWEAVRVH